MTLLAITTNGSLTVSVIVVAALFVIATLICSNALSKSDKE
jgi:preprotein translocase subunit SecG